MSAKTTLRNQRSQAHEPRNPAPAAPSVREIAHKLSDTFEQRNQGLVAAWAEGLILICSRNSINNPIPSGNTFDPFVLQFEGSERVDQVILQRIERIEGFVVEALLA